MKDPVATYYEYSAAWNEQDAGHRNDLLDRAWADDAVFADEETPGGLVGRAALSEYIALQHEQMPGLVITETSTPQVVGNRLRVRWVARQDEAATFIGTDFVEFAGDGRVSRVTMFDDSDPDELGGETQKPD